MAPPSNEEEAGHEGSAYQLRLSEPLYEQGPRSKVVARQSLGGAMSDLATHPENLDAAPGDPDASDARKSR
jgi:hypothetical protein